MIKRFRNLLLEALAGLSGNLIAGWIQNDIFNNLFTPLRVLATVGAFLLALTLLAWLESQNDSSGEITTNHRNIRGQSLKLDILPWDWLAGSLILNISIGWLFSGLILNAPSLASRGWLRLEEVDTLRTPFIPSVALIIALVWIWQKHWVETNTKAEEIAQAIMKIGAVAMVVIFEPFNRDLASEIPFGSWLVAAFFAFLTYQGLAAFPESTKIQLFQSYGKFCGFCILLLNALIGLLLGWSIHNLV